MFGLKVNFEFRTFRSAAIGIECEFLIPIQYSSKIGIASPEINLECYIQMHLSRTVYFHSLSV